MVAFDRSPFKLFSLRISTKYVHAPSCERPKTTQRTLSLSFEIKNCFPIAVLRRSFMKKSEKLTCQVVNSNIAIDSSPTLQISLEIVTLFEKIYDGEPIITVVSNIVEDVQYRCFKCDVKSVSQPDTIALLGTNYSFQIVETEFADQFYAYHRMEPAPICLKISASTA